jgi:hypothetical protein
VTQQVQVRRMVKHAKSMALAFCKSSMGRHPKHF